MKTQQHNYPLVISNPQSMVTTENTATAAALPVSLWDQLCAVLGREGLPLQDTFDQMVDAILWPSLEWIRPQDEDTLTSRIARDWQWLQQPADDHNITPQPPPCLHIDEYI